MFSQNAGTNSFWGPTMKYQGSRAGLREGLIQTARICKVHRHSQAVVALTRGVKFNVYIVNVYSAGASRKSYELRRKSPQ